MDFGWKRFSGYEVSTKGDRRFSAFNAIMEDGRSLEVHFQCDIKRYDVGGTNWRLGKGKPPKPLTDLEKLNQHLTLYVQSREELWKAYLKLWQRWCHNHVELLADLREKIIAYHQVKPSEDGVLYLMDRFATTPINQAHALSVILNEREQC